MRILREERGWTIHEFAIVSVLLAFVLAATLTLFDKTIEVFPEDAERAHALRDAQVGLHAMTRELRQAYAVDLPKEAGAARTGVVRARVSVRSADYLVTYDCTVPHPGPGDKCVRDSLPLVAGVPSGPIERRDVLLRVLNGTEVFKRPSATFMEARVEVPALGERDSARDHDVVLDDGFQLRNVSAG